MRIHEIPAATENGNGSGLLLDPRFSEKVDYLRAKYGAADSIDPAAILRKVEEIAAGEDPAPVTAAQQPAAATLSGAEAAYQKAVAAGLVKIHGTGVRATQPAKAHGINNAVAVDRWREEWTRDPALQAEFRTAETYVCYRRAMADGLVRGRLAAG